MEHMASDRRQVIFQILRAYVASHGGLGIGLLELSGHLLG
jgi:hypothetical protein